MAILPREYAIYKCNEPQYRSVGENILLQQIDMQTQRPQDVISDRSPCGPVCMWLALKTISISRMDRLIELVQLLENID